jgi:hypothetical protein
MAALDSATLSAQLMPEMTRPYLVQGSFQSREHLKDDYMRPVLRRLDKEDR